MGRTVCRVGSDLYVFLQPASVNTTTHQVQEPGAHREHDAQLRIMFASTYERSEIPDTIRIPFPAPPAPF